MAELGEQSELKEPSGLSSPPKTLERTSPPESEIARARRLLGLPEKSPLLDQEKIASDRKKTVDLFCEERLENILKGSGGFIDRHLTQIVKEEKEKLEEESKIKGPSRFSKWFLVNKMKHYGVKDPEETLLTIQTEDNCNFYPQSWSEKAVASNLAEFDNQELKIALHRLRVLGYPVSPTDFEDKTFTKFLKELVEVNEENFQKVCEELNPYFFISDYAVHDYSEKYQGSISPSFLTLMEIVKNGGLSLEQKQKLGFLQRFALLSFIPTVDNEGNFQNKEKSDLESLLNNNLPKNLAVQAMLITESSVYDVLQKQTEGKKVEMGLAIFNINNQINFLNRKGYLPAVCEMINQGVNCKSSVFEVGYSIYPTSDEKEFQASFPKILEFSKNKEKLEWAALFAEVAGNGLDREKVEMYEETYQKRESLVNFLIFLQAVPKDLENQFKDLVKVYNVDYLPGIDVGILLIGFSDRLKDYPFPAQISKEEMLFFENLQFFLSEWTSDRHHFRLVGEDKLAREKVAARHLAFLSYIGQNKSRVAELMNRNGLTEKALEEMLEGKIKISSEDINYWFSKYFLFYNATIRPEVLLKHIDVFDQQNLFGITKYLSSVSQFITDKIIETLPEKQQLFWRFFKKLPDDAREFLVRNEARFSTYVTVENKVDEVAFRHDFITQTVITPERIQTYELLTAVFDSINQLSLTDQERGLIYLRISESYQINRLNQRTGVEAISPLQRAFAQLYRREMTPFEKQCWRILQKQLPFTADEQIRVAMREQALVVEALDQTDQQRYINRLSWVHQMIHNYASTKAPAYLSTFRDYLVTGNNQEFLKIRETYQTADCRCPDLNESDRQELQKALPEVNRLVELTNQFYEIKPERLNHAIDDVRPILSRYSGLESELEELMTAATTAVKIDVSSEQTEKAETKFCLQVNTVRSRIMEAILAVDVQRKSRLLVLDSVLSGLSQQFFVRYTDRIRPLIESGKFSTQDAYKATAIFYEIITASLLEGENFDPDPKANLTNKIDFFARFKDPTKVVPNDLHVASLFIPLISARMNTLWGRFIQVAQPEMKDMLTRLGVPEQDAFNRVYMTDLVEYRKKSMSYVIEPMVPLIAQVLKTTKDRLSDNTAHFYEEIIPSKKILYHLPDVDQAISSITNKEMPAILDKASSFLSGIANSPFTKAEKLCRIFFPEYLNRDDPNQRLAVEITVDGDKIDIFPFEHYGIDGVVLRLNGRIINNPETYLLKRFRPPAAVKAFLKEGG